MSANLQLIRNILCWPFRHKLIARPIINKVTVLDFNNLKDCFVVGGCVVYYGLGGFSISGCKFIECTFVFAGPAKNTVIANNALAAAGWGGLKEIEAARNEVRA